MQLEIEVSIWIKLFFDWELETWANVLEVVGFVFSIAAFTMSLFITSAIKKLKTDILFDKRINKHIKNLSDSSSKINQHLNDYNNNINEIQSELGLCIAELQDLIKKIDFWDRRKSKRLICFLKFIRKNKFSNKEESNHSTNWFIKNWVRIYKTSYEDIWQVYHLLIEILRQIENIKENKSKSKSS